mgnify:CR=1 FL=1
MMAGDVITRVKAVKIAPHVRQLLLAIGGQRLGRFVARPCRALRGDLRGKVRGGREFGGTTFHFKAERWHVAGQANLRVMLELEGERRHLTVLRD